MSFTKVETLSDKKTPYSIKPYFESSVENMGLQNYGLILFDGCMHEEQLCCIEQNGIKRYITGLNEFAPEIKNIKDKKKKEAKIKEIRIIVSRLEKELAANIVDPEDKEFWNKIKLLKPTNSEFWDNIIIRIGNEPLFLDPNKPYDLIKLYGIKAGGFSLIAGSYNKARNADKAPKFYLDDQRESVTIKNEYRKYKNTALAKLQELYQKNPLKLMFIAKVLDGHSVIYSKNTPHDVIYEAMDMYINAEGVEKHKERAATSFISTSELDMEELKIRSLIKDCSYYKFIALKSDGMIYHIDKQIPLGKTVDDIIMYLKNPVNDEILADLYSKVEMYWND